MTITRTLLIGATVLSTVGLVVAQGGPGRDLSPAGSSAAQVEGKWVQGAQQQFTFGRGSYQGGKWIDITYGRPLKRGRDPWGTGANYGKDLLIGAPIWRAGANVTTQLTSEAPLSIGGKTLAAGTTYTVFIDLKEHEWTLVLSTLAAQKAYDPNDKVNTFGAYNYVATKDVVRVPMKLETLPHAFEQLSWQFVDMTPTGGTLALLWDKTMASVRFTTQG
jgi:hypothetical protein